MLQFKMRPYLTVLLTISIVLILSLIAHLVLFIEAKKSLLNCKFVFGLMLFIAPGLFTAILLDQESLIEQLYTTFAVSVSLSIIISSLLIAIKLFSSLFVILSYLIVSTILFYFITISYKRKKILSSKIEPNDFIVLFGGIIGLVLTYFFQGNAIFPVSWDLGKHFGYIIYILYHGHVPNYYLGTFYKQFYPLGFHLAVSIFIRLTSSFSNALSLDNSAMHILEESTLSFIFFKGILNCFSLFGVYSLAKEIYHNKNIALVSSLFFLWSIGYFVTAETAPRVLFFCLFGFVFIEIKKIIETNDGISHQLLFMLTFTAAILTYYTEVIYLLIAMLLVFIIGKIWRFTGQYRTMLILTFLSLITSVIIMQVLGGLFEGILSELTRKLSTSYSSYLNPMQTSTINIALSKEGFWRSYTFLIPLLVISFLYDIRHLSKNGRYVIPLVLSTVVSIVLPIPPIRASYLLLYPLSILSGEGLVRIFEFLEEKSKHLKFKYNYSKKILKKNKPRYFFFVLTTMLFISGTYLSEIRVYQVKYRYSSNFAFNAYQISKWINENLATDSVIVFPESGPTACLIAAMTNRTFVFADPRYEDMPIMREVAMLYMRYPTNLGLFDYSNVTLAERAQVIKRYNITAIIQVDNVIYVNVTAFKILFPNLQVFKVNEVFSIVVLDDSKYIGNLIEMQNYM